MFYSTIDRDIHFNASCRMEGNFVEEDLADKAETITRRIDLYCVTGSPALTAKWVPRMPMVAVGVSKRAFSGASFPMSPER